MSIDRRILFGMIERGLCKQYPLWRLLERYPATLTKPSLIAVTEMAKLLADVL